MEKVYIIKKDDLKSWLKDMGKDMNVYLPAQDTEKNAIDFYSLAEIESQLNFESQGEGKYRLELEEKTRLSPKYIIYPQFEDLLGFRYQKDPENLEDVKINLKVDYQEEKTAVFGIKPCDVQAISRLDKVFGQGVAADPYYIKRRENTLLISVGCENVFGDCFCTSVGSSPFDFSGADIGFMGTDGLYVAFVYTAEGEELARTYSKYFKEAGKEEIAGYKSKLEEKNRKATEAIPGLWPDTKEEDIPDIMDKSFEDGLWEKISEKCIGCGACTFVCPTCYCFDIRDDKDNIEGKRYRCWDYCTSYLYTLEASGHNPRENLSQRYRNKVNCKYNYNYKRQESLYCVGCGRCIEVCPVDMDIREIVKKVIKNKGK